MEYGGHNGFKEWVPGVSHCRRLGRPDQPLHYSKGSAPCATRMGLPLLLLV